MKGVRSPALANLATLVIGWIALRLIMIGTPEWLTAKEFPAKSGRTKSALVGQFREPASAAGTTTQSRNQFRPSAVTRRRSIDLPLRGMAPRFIEFPLMIPAEAHRTPQLDSRPSGGLPVLEPMAGPNEGRGLPANTSRNWMLSGYALVRTGGGQAGIADNGQLGGSQVGLRVQRTLFRFGHLILSANGRASAPITQRNGKEAGLGLALKRQGRLPIELLLERRIGLDAGGRDAVAALVATGFDDFRLPAKLLLSGYGQAGVVGLKSRDGFVDGAIRAEHELLTAGKTDIRIGAVLAGATQPGVSRVDIGPAVAARFRVARASVRLTAEWRERIGGNALPGSGPAVTLGFDY